MALVALLSLRCRTQGDTSDVRVRRAITTTAPNAEPPLPSPPPPPPANDVAWDLSLNSAPPRNSNIKPKKPSVRNMVEAKRVRAPIHQPIYPIQLLRHSNGLKHAKSLSGCSSRISAILVLWVIAPVSIVMPIVLTIIHSLTDQRTYHDYEYKPPIPWIDIVIERLQKLYGVSPAQANLAQVISLGDAVRIIDEAKKCFMSESCLAEIVAPCKVIGDIHGQFQDMHKLFDIIGRVPKERLVFLGDYIDRGPQSLEVVFFLFAWKIRYPERVMLLRGNHETPAVNKIYGFYNECLMKYQYPGIGLWWDFQSCFNRMPMAGLIAKKVLCMHGGLSPDLTHLDVLRNIVRPCEPLDRGLLIDLLWADPTNQGDGWFHSIRGISYMFGKGVVEQGCQILGVDLIIRAHQVIQDGYEIMTGRKLITVFSAPNYCNQFSNTAAVVCLDADLKVTIQQMVIPLPASQRARPAPAIAIDLDATQAEQDIKAIMVVSRAEAKADKFEETQENSERAVPVTTGHPGQTPPERQTVLLFQILTVYQFISPLVRKKRQLLVGDSFVIPQLTFFFYNFRDLPYSIIPIPSVILQSMPNCLQFGLLLALCVCCVDTQNVTKTLPSYEILTFDFSAIETPFVVASWLAIASGVKILFHFIRPLSKYFPDSSLLVFVGFALGWILHYGIESIKAEYYQLESVYFFHFLLPPIIFDAGYFMPNRALFENFGSVMLFAVIGTVWNTIAIGGGLYLLSLYGLFSIPFDAFEVLTFTSLISAVDPVAVIAVFEEVHVNEFLFINVFGEALFNDAVSVVLYKMFKNFYDIGPERVEIADYGKGVVSFFAIAVGGTAVGIIFAFVVAIVTKFSDHIRILAPIFVFVVPYMAYLLADSMGMSSILAISVCGMVMKQYVKGNLTPAATNSVKYFTKMLAVGAETLLFMFLGVSAIVTPHHFDWAFISITVAFCLIFRSIGVMVQCAILNKFRKKKFSLVDQFILSYGGLRGAIAFGLSVSLPDSMAAKPMFVTTTIAVIYFTVLLQGITIRPIVNWLKVERSDGRQKTMTESVFMKYIDYTMSGVEEIFGIRGEHYIRDTYERINAKILRPILMRNEEKKDFDASVIVRAYAKITLEEALALKEHLPKKKKIDKK
ncbi:unnamed protein product, partial [Mesorhabditis belari]|uniref:Multifunctional fusion protein n=1 Tax=Mesorhabditis belari TaxID=2138241 RepID=A0AAF3FBR8_9BILA